MPLPTLLPRVRVRARGRARSPQSAVAAAFRWHVLSTVPVIPLLALLLLAAIPGPAADWSTITGPPDLAFPRDHGAHPEYRTEWWYLTGIVSDAEGREYGFQLTFFRQGLDPRPPAPGDSPLRARQAVAGHLAVAEITAGRFRHAERLRRADDELAGFATDDLDVRLDTWRLRRGAEDVLEARGDDRVAGIALELRLEPLKPLVRQGVDGYSRKGPEPGNASAYLSWTRLAVRGTLELDGEARAVTGEGWFDHEWGTSQLGAGVVGWDWFSLRLADGRELMVYRLRRADGTPDPFSSGTLVGPDGDVRRLDAGDVRLEVTDHWTSPATGAVYPAGWRLAVPSADLALEVRPRLADAELDGRTSTGVVYWEGPVAVAGTADGEGYVELTGYAGSLAGRF